MEDSRTFAFSGSLVAVIGATGFIGSHLIDSLLSSGCRVIAIGRNFPGLISSSALQNPNLSFHISDISDSNYLEHYLVNVDIIVHLASSSLPKDSNKDPNHDIQTNLIGSLNILNLMVKYSIKKIVFVSSGGTIYGNPVAVPVDELHPTNPTCSYGIVKLAIEKYISLYQAQHGINAVILRLSNPYGIRQRLRYSQGVVPVFLDLALRSQPLHVWGDGTVIRDFIYISDAVNAILSSCTYEGNPCIFNIGSGNGTSLNYLIQIIEDVVGRKQEVVYHESRSFDVPTNVLSIDRAVKYLQWHPVVSTNEGIRVFHDYLLAHRSNLET